MSRLRRSNDNLFYLFIISLIAGSYWSMINPIYQPFMLSLGISISTMGLLEALRGRIGLLSTLSQLLGGVLADKYGRKRLIIVCSIVTLLALIFHLLAALLKNVQLLIIGSLILALAWIGTPAWNAMTMESTDRCRRGFALSLVWFASIAPSIVLSPIGGWLVENYGYRLVFFIGIFMETICLVLILLLLRESLERNITSSCKELLTNLIPKSKTLKRLYLIVALDSFTWCIGTSLFYGFLVEWFKFREIELGLLSSIFTLSWTITQIPAGKIVDKYGSKTAMIFSELMGISTLALWLIAKDFTTFIVSEILFGITPALWIPALNTYIAEKAPKDRVSGTLGGVSAFRGLISFPAPYIGGYLFDLAGFYLPVTVSLIGVVFTLLAIIFLLESQPILLHSNL